MYYLLLGLTGGVIAVMVSANGALSRSAGKGTALIIIHVTGLLVSSLVVHFARTPAKNSAKPPPLLYLPGLLGVALTWAGIYSVNTIGITLTLSLRLLGQLAGSFIIDLTGMPGFKKKALSIPRLLTLILASAGCLLMMDFSELLSFPVLIALGAGFLAVLIAAMNASLGTYIGVFRSVRINFITGLLGSFIYFFLSRLSFSVFGPALFSLPWYVLIGGGVCGVVVVAGMTKCLPHVSIMYSTLVLFVGQLIFGYVLDLITGSPVNMKTVSGGLVIALGLSVELFSFLFINKKMNRQSAL